MVHRPCPVCRRTRDLTEEHVIPRWARKAITDLSPELLPPQWSSKLWICAECNRTLGQRFESPAAPILKPMFRGEQIHLSPHQQEVAGAWHAKTCLMLLLKDAQVATFGKAPPELRRNDAQRKLAEMLETGRPPTQTSVRLGKGDVRDTSSPESPDGGYRPPLPLPHIPVRMLGCTGWLAHQVLIGKPESLLVFEQKAQDIEWFIPVWPPQVVSLRWPPTRIMSNADLLRLNLDWQSVATTAPTLFPPRRQDRRGYRRSYG